MDDLHIYSDKSIYVFSTIDDEAEEVDGYGPLGGSFGVEMPTEMGGGRSGTVRHVSRRRRRQRRRRRL